MKPTSAPTGKQCKNVEMQTVPHAQLHLSSSFLSSDGWNAIPYARNALWVTGTDPQPLGTAL